MCDCPLLKTTVRKRTGTLLDLNYSGGGASSEEPLLWPQAGPSIPRSDGQTRNSSGVNDHKPAAGMCPELSSGLHWTPQ